MKKLITLSNLTTGTTVNCRTGEVRKVDARPFSKKQIKSIAKNIAELHNANMKREEEEEKWEAFKKNVISNPLPLTQTADVEEGYYKGETVKLFVNGKKIIAIGSCKKACEIALNHIRDHTKDIIKSQKCDDVTVRWKIEEAEALGICKIISGNIEESCCKNCEWFREGKDNFNFCGNSKCGLEDTGHKTFKLFFRNINKCDFWEGRSYFIGEIDYGVNIK